MNLQERHYDSAPREASSAQKWPDTVWLVRHGQSAGNVAREQAEAAGISLIDIAMRDMDVPLSDLGEQQARALGRWFAQLPEAQQPKVVLSSSYLRARQTAALIIQTAGMDVEAIIDERLREKEFGLLDRLTKKGIIERYPDLHEQRSHVGKFYFRPPGGESWCDVILRLRSAIDTLTREYRRDRVLIVGHQVIVNCFRYLFERLTEQEILAIDRQADVPNCAVTSYVYDPNAGRRGKLRLDLVNFLAPLEATGTPVTEEPDAPVAAKP